jgi:hypothetical protein
LQIPERNNTEIGPTGLSEDFLRARSEEFQRQYEFDKVLYEHQQISPVVFGNPGQPHGAGGFGALKAGMQVYGMIEGDMGY